MNLEYIKVDLDMVRNTDCDSAILYALIKQSRLPKDNHGFISFDSSYIIRSTGWSRRHFYRVRDKLVSCNRLQVIYGSNQNTKPRYKLR